MHDYEATFSHQHHSLRGNNCFTDQEYCVYYLLHNFVQYVLNYLYSPYSITEESGVSTRIGAEDREEGVSDEITEDEVRWTIWKLRSCKSSGVCGIEGELLKAVR